MDTAPTFVTRINIPEIKATGSWWVDIHNNSGTQVAIFGAGGTTGTSLAGTTNIGSASADYHQITWWTGTITDTATGSSTNININLVPKGSGKLKVNSVNVLLSWDTATTTNALQSATTTINVSSATAPSNWQVLTATSSTTATWQTPSGGGSWVTTADAYIANRIFL
jgi:hypothetical protein